jgi:hypothetical protein
MRLLTRHPSRLLAQYCDGQLPSDQMRNIETHVVTCERCRRERDDILFAASLMRQLAGVSPPPSVWHAIENQLHETRSTAWHWRWQAAFAVLALAITAGVLYQHSTRPVGGQWEIALRESGRSEQLSKKAEGDWVETTSSSRARIVVGSIGTVEIEPHTRVRLGALRSDEYRLDLAHGTITAQIAAPPRLFIVETPASTLVDLGCAYRVTVSVDGTGELQVTEGWTALEWRGRESLVPAGASARIRPGEGPGMPTFDDASASLKAAVVAFDSGNREEATVGTMLTEARVRDTLTLWHLLTRTDGDNRARVHERLQALVPAPPNAPPDAVMRLDGDALRHWREELAWHW